MSAPRILVAGEINADLVLGDLSAFPEPGREVTAGRAELVLGSSSAICASGLARLRNQVSFVGKAGDDLVGRFCREEMRARGIAVDRVALAPGERTGLTVALSWGPDRALATYLGASASFSVRDIGDEALEGFDHLHVSSLFLQTGIREGLPDLFRRARLRGMSTSLDPGCDPEGEWRRGVAEALKEVDLFLPNQQELQATSGEADLESALRSFAPSRVVVKLGASGAAALVDSALVRVEAPPIKALDTTGAGDSFDAGFLHAWLRDEPLATCLRWGVAAGSLSTGALGGTRAQATREEIEDLLAG